jgi:hypothetical protein
MAEKDNVLKMKIYGKQLNQQSAKNPLASPSHMTDREKELMIKKSLYKKKVFKLPLMG